MLASVQAPVSFKQNPPRPLASRRVEASKQHQTLQTSQNLKQAHKGEGLPSPYPLPDGPARILVRTLGVLRPVLASKKRRRNVYFLFMDPFGSDQSRHADDFGAKEHNFDDLDAKKSSC